MTRFSLSHMRRAAAPALLGMVVAACSATPYTTSYYSNPTNPRPELMGTLIKPSDVRVFANATNPFPTLGMGSTAVAEKVNDK